MIEDDDEFENNLRGTLKAIISYVTGSYFGDSDMAA